MKLTKSELEVMNVMWKAERPLSRADILNLSEDKTWKDNSIHILLNGMLKKAPFLRTALLEAARYGDDFMPQQLVLGNTIGKTFFSRVARKHIRFF